MKTFTPIAFALIAFHQGKGANALKKSKGYKSSNEAKTSKRKTKKSKQSNAGKNSSITGRYLGHDIEDGSEQFLDILCNDGLCDVILGDALFSTCVAATGSFFGGVAIARDIPLDKLDDFKLPLYCKAQNELEIDLDKVPDSFLTGNIVSPREGGLFRKGPGFNYYKISEPEIKSLYSKMPSPVNNEFVDINGSYSATDIEDGSGQFLSVFCADDNFCDISLRDPFFSTCTRINGALFSKGVAVAKGVPRDSLDDFGIDLYCLLADETEVDIDDPLRQPDQTLTGDFLALQDGIIRRTGPGFTFLKNSKPASPTNDFSQRLFAVDTEDGSLSGFDLTCAEGLCNMTLFDQSFSSCFDFFEPGDVFIPGLAVAQDIPQDSLDDFRVDLYCAPDATGVIDYDSPPTTTLDGSLLFLEDGIIRRTGPKFTYFNRFWEEKGRLPTSMRNGVYQGTNFNGDGEFVYLTCANRTCQLTQFNYVFPQCILPPNFKTFYNGFGIAKNIPEDSLDNFDVEIYCTAETGQEIDLEVDRPTFIEGYGLVPIDPPGAILRPETEPRNTILYKYSSE